MLRMESFPRRQKDNDIRGIHLRELIVDASFKVFKTEVKKRGCLFAGFLLDFKLFCVVI